MMETMRSASNKRTRGGVALLLCMLLIGLTACQSAAAPPHAQQPATPTPQASPSPNVIERDEGNIGQALREMDKRTPERASISTPTAQPGMQPSQTASTPTVRPATPRPTSGSQGAGTPVLAFYYPWYSTSTWCRCHMSDLPTTLYNSSDDTTIDRQLTWAANAGITGFISSWWGQGDQTDTNFAKLLAHSAALESSTGIHFASTIYFESDAPALSGESAIVSQLRYVIDQYGSAPHFFHWQGKPVIFFWDPLGHGRSLSEWASIRSQVDPSHQTVWSAEGVNMDLLSVFDGIHLFSGGYWGIQSNDMPQVDQGFRSQIDAYNSAHGTTKVWAAGVLPGYDDTRVPGRSGTFTVPRNKGATYTTSWNAAISSHPDWITITSFNEWFEGSMIEPSTSYGMLYLNLTQQFTKQVHG